MPELSIGVSFRLSVEEQNTIAAARRVDRLTRDDVEAFIRQAVRLNLVAARVAALAGKEGLDAEAVSD